MSHYSATHEHALQSALEGLVDCFDTNNIPFTIETADGVSPVNEETSEALEYAERVLYDEDYDEGDPEE